MRPSGQRALAQSTPPVPPTILGGADYKLQTLMFGTLSKQQSQMAAMRAVNPRVREFAQFEVDEQITIAQVLTAENNPPDAPMGPAQQAKLSQLQGLSGRSFDVAYVQDQMQGHQQLYAIQQEFLNGDPAVPDRLHMAMMSRTLIQMHLTMLTDLQNMLTTA